MLNGEPHESRSQTGDARADGNGRRLTLARPPAPGSALEESYERARSSRDTRERFAAYALETLTAFIPARLALHYDVDRSSTMAPAMALRHRDGKLPATDPLARRLVGLEPIDPFSVRRAQIRGSLTLSAEEVGGERELRRSMYGRHLAQLGIGAPLHAYLWREARVVAGVMLLRSAAEPAFDRDEARLLGEFGPLLEDAMVHGCSAVCRARLLPGDVLTARELEVAALVLDGASNACISAKLGMGETTVKTHLTRIYAKLGIRSRTELATRYRCA